MELQRHLGFEFEGYFLKYPLEVSVPHCEIKRDGSLRNSAWNPFYGRYGVEVVTEKTKDLSILEDAFSAMKEAGWRIARGASTHIHVEARDFSMKDRFKIHIVSQLFSPFFHLFVKNYRWNNRYCKQINSGWMRMLDLDFNQPESFFQELFARNYFITSKYTWINIFHTRYPTIELRLFHPIKKVKEAETFGIMAHNYVEVMKNSTVEHLKFMAEHIKKSSSVHEMAEKFCEMLQLDTVPPIINKFAIEKCESMIQQNSTIPQAI